MGKFSETGRRPFIPSGGMLPRSWVSTSSVRGSLWALLEEHRHPHSASATVRCQPHRVARNRGWHLCRYSPSRRPLYGGVTSGFVSRSTLPAFQSSRHGLILCSGARVQTQTEMDRTQAAHRVLSHRFKVCWGARWARSETECPRERFIS